MSGDCYGQRVELNSLSERGKQGDEVATELCLELVDTTSDTARRRKVAVAHCVITLHTAIIVVNISINNNNNFNINCIIAKNYRSPSYL